jgi:hypothetical protein
MIDEISTIQVGSGVNCGIIDVAGPDYSWIFSSHSGSPGEEVTVSGPTRRGEDGRYAPADHVEIWWGSGEGVELVGQVDVARRCAFVARFRVPDVSLGTFPVEVRVYFHDGYGVLARSEFRVT